VHPRELRLPLNTPSHPRQHNFICFSFFVYTSSLLFSASRSMMVHRLANNLSLSLSHTHTLSPALLQTKERSKKENISAYNDGEPG
jgi:hypothetical protein